MRVGLIGVGAMGEALMSRLHAAGREVQAYDISEKRLRLAGQQGAHTVRSAADAARDVDFVHVFVRTDEELLDVTLGNGGVLAAAREGSLVFLHSTVMPATTQEISEKAPRRVGVMDASVTAVPRVVAEGKAVFLVGGTDADAAIAKPYLKPLGRAVYHFGPVGTGNIAKVAKNLINASERIALSEVCAIVEAGGLKVEQFLEMAAAVDRGSTVSRWQDAIAIDNNHALPRRASNLYNKDVGLAADLARALGVKAPVAQAAADTARSWVDAWEKSD